MVGWSVTLPVGWIIISAKCGASLSPLAALAGAAACRDNTIAILLSEVMGD